MVLDSIRDLIADKDPTPNKFTKAMGELIRKAREEAGISQAELAQMIYRRQATLSDIENGKSEANIGTLLLLAAALEKPPSYFYHPFLYRELKPDKFSPLEQEALATFQNINSAHLQMLAIEILHDISKFDPEEMLIDSIEKLANKNEQEVLVRQLVESKKNK